MSKSLYSLKYSDPRHFFTRKQEKVPLRLIRFSHKDKMIFYKINSLFGKMIPINIKPSGRFFPFLFDLSANHQLLSLNPADVS